MKNTLKIITVLLFISLLLVSCKNKNNGTNENQNNDSTSEHTHIAGEALKENETPATCTERGSYTEVVCCVECDKELSRCEKLVSIAGHKIQNDVCTVCKKAAHQNLDFHLSENGNYYIVSGIGECTDTDIIIPSTHNGLPVKELGYLDSDFDLNTYLSYLYEWINITSLAIPSSVSSINCVMLFYSLENISVDEDNTEYASIDGNLYSKDITTLIQYSCGKVEDNFTVPNGVTEIRDGAFYNCLSIKSINIPASVTQIGEYLPSDESDDNNSSSNGMN